MIIFLSCEKEEVEPVEPPKNNVVFLSTGAAYDVSGTQTGTFKVNRDYSGFIPNCESIMYEGCLFKTMYLKAGTYNVWITSEQVNRRITLTVYEDRCNYFDCKYPDAW